MHGYWDEDTTKDRCILRCDAGYEPSGCHVIRYSYREGKWNHDIPSCQKVTQALEETSLVSATKTVVAGVLHQPWDALLKVARANLLLGQGFGAAWLAAWQIAARIHTRLTAADSQFPSQRAGVVGTAATTKGAVTRVITNAASDAFSNCEAE